MKIQLAVAFLFTLLGADAAVLARPTPVGTAFTYQGQLKLSGSPITGSVDCQFSLFDGPAGGSPINGLTLSQNLTATDGLFTTDLDFGAGALIGEERWLGIAVRYPAGSGNYTPLVPRQRLNPAPYSLFALNAMVFGTQGGAVNFTNAANAFAGSGSGLTSLNASNINSGTLGSAQMSGAYSNALNFNNASNVFAGSFSGGGAGLTGVNANLLDGLDSTAFLQTIPLPFSGSTSVANPTAAFKITNTGTGYGVWGEGKDGVHGFSATLGGNGVFGEANNGIGAYGVYGLSSGGRGVFGASDSGSGVYGHSETGAGMFGNSTSNYGVYGQSSGANGIYGVSLALGGSGVYGEADNGNNAVGVRGSSNAGIGVVGQTLSPTGRGVWGVCGNPAGASFGGRFDNPSTAGYGVLASASATSGATFGGYLQADSTAGTGVYGYATATSGFTFGGLFQCNSPDGRAVRATNSATTGQAVGGRFSSSSNSGMAVWSTASASTGTTYGGFFESTSSAGLGVYGQASAATGVTYGGRFLSTSNAGIGVSGVASATVGATYGVHGQSSSGAASYGVYSQGNLGCSGNKQFRIDHPDDPENKYLLHYSAESPEVINFYRGTAVLNGVGEAVVELPHYFAKINKDPSYVLTAVGAPMPNLHVAEEIYAASLTIGSMAEPGQAVPPCWFRIAGGAPGMKVSWRVEAARNDRWAQQRGAPVEIEKQDFERGTYQHPELYGQPVEKGMNYDAAPSMQDEPDARVHRPSPIANEAGGAR